MPVAEGALVSLSLMSVRFADAGLSEHVAWASWLFSYIDTKYIFSKISTRCAIPIQWCTQFPLTLLLNIQAWEVNEWSKLQTALHKNLQVGLYSHIVPATIARKLDWVWNGPHELASTGSIAANQDIH